MLDRRIALSILAFTFYTTTAIAQNDTRVCYDASNRVSSDLRPCVSPSTQEISHCCSTADTCIGDTLCLSQWGTLFVGGCTVKDWVNGANGRNFCPKYCSSAGKDIGVCENANGGWDFCCGLLGGHENCCAEKYGRRFKITGNATNNLLVQRPWNNSTIGPTITSPPVSSSTSSSAASQCPTPNNNKSAQIGLGAGLGVALIILLCLFLWENRQRRRLEKSLKAYAGAAGYIQYSPEQMSQSQGYQTVTAYEVDNLKGVRNELSNLQQVHELAHDDRAPT